MNNASVFNLRDNAKNIYRYIVRTIRYQICQLKFSTTSFLIMLDNERKHFKLTYSVKISTFQGRLLASILPFFPVLNL